MTDSGGSDLGSGDPPEQVPVSRDRREADQRSERPSHPRRAAILLMVGVVVFLVLVSVATEL